jgi:hypothetical protein
MHEVEEVSLLGKDENYLKEQTYAKPFLKEINLFNKCHFYGAHTSS